MANLDINLDITHWTIIMEMLLRHVTVWAAVKSAVPFMFVIEHTLHLYVYIPNNHADPASVCVIATWARASQCHVLVVH